MEADVLSGILFLPPISDFPTDSELADREVLNRTCLVLRNWAARLSMKLRFSRRR
jgi:hypothetical protein